MNCDRDIQNLGVPYLREAKMLHVCVQFKLCWEQSILREPPPEQSKVRIVALRRLRSVERAVVKHLRYSGHSIRMADLSEIKIRSPREGPCSLLTPGPRRDNCCCHFPFAPGLRRPQLPLNKGSRPFNSPWNSAKSGRFLWVTTISGSYVFSPWVFPLQQPRVPESPSPPLGPRQRPAPSSSSPERFKRLTDSQVLCREEPCVKAPKVSACHTV